MNLYGISQRTTRQLSSAFIQLFIQWFDTDITDTDVAINKGCSRIVVRTDLHGGSAVYFNIYGRDVHNRSYYKSIGFTLDTDILYYKTAPNNQYVVVEDMNFNVRRVSDHGHQYYIINTPGIYILLDLDDLLLHSEYFDDISIYEFNTMFPVIAQSEITLRYNKDNIYNSIILNGSSITDSSDFSWSINGNTINGNIPDPKVIDITENSSYVKYINGQEIINGAVNVLYNLASGVKSVSLHQPENSEFSNITPIPIPGSVTEGVEAFCKLPNKLLGIMDNATIFNAYNFSLDAPLWKTTEEESDSGKASHYCYNCDSTWLTIPSDGTEDNNQGIADMKLKIDGNSPLLPVLPANTITETPEYRVFNPHFVSDATIEVIMNSLKFNNEKIKPIENPSGYFKLTSVSSKRSLFAVCDGGTVNSSGTKSGPSIAIVTRDGDTKKVEVEYTSESISKRSTLYVYLKATLDESMPIEDAYVRVETSPKLLEEHFEEPNTKCILIGRVSRKNKTKTIKQDHIGTAYFDFSKKGSGAYKGTFAINLHKAEVLPDQSSDTYDKITVSAGEIRVINRQYLIDTTELTPVNAGVIYLHVSIDTGTVVSKVEMADTFPSTEDDTNSYYRLGEIVADESDNLQVVQDHHGGTPLFLFFSKDCIS